MMNEPTSHSPVCLTGEYILDYTMESLQRHFEFSAHGYRCTTKDLWRVLICAAARRQTIESVCNDLTDTPDSNTVRGHLSAQLGIEHIPDIERRCNHALQEQLPDWLLQQAQEVALDWHDEPYYGHSEPHAPQNWVCRGRAKDGTTYFYRCATAYVIRKGARLTLAILFMKPGMPMEEIVQRLLTMVSTLGVCIKRLYLDKGFLSVAVMRYLGSQSLPTIIAVPLSTGSGGVRTLCRGRSSYCTKHTFHNPQHGEVTVELALARTYAHVRSKHRWATWYAFACLNVRESAQRIRQLYRRRFGIESQYRMMEQVRARTTSLNAALRFLLIGLALLILNVRVKLHWLFLRVPSRGPRQAASWRLRLDRMARLMSRAVEHHYGAVTHLVTFVT
jgi:hypothetical protein